MNKNETLEQSNKRLRNLHNTMRKTYSKSYTIEMNQNSNNEFDNIIVFDNFQLESESPELAMYDRWGSARFIDIDGYEEIDDFEIWKKTVSESLGIKIDWDFIKENGNLTICLY